MHNPTEPGAEAAEPPENSRQRILASGEAAILASADPAILPSADPAILASADPAILPSAEGSDVPAADENGPVEGGQHSVDLSRLGWLIIVVVLLITDLILFVKGYYGYFGATLAVAISAAINLI